MMFRRPGHWETSDLRTELPEGMDVTTSFSAWKPERFLNTSNIFLASSELTPEKIKLNQIHINITDTLSAWLGQWGKNTDNYVVQKFKLYKLKT